MQVERPAMGAADGRVTRGNVPFSSEQPRETWANTEYVRKEKDLSLKDRPASDYLVGEVTAHQGDDQ